MEATYFNPRFKAHLLNGTTYISSEYGYAIDKADTGRDDFWELTIQTTGISEIDGVEPGFVEEYQYASKEQAQQDINTANQYSNIEFHEL